MTDRPNDQHQGKPVPDVEEIHRALDVLFEPDVVVELRAFKNRRCTVSGYYDDFDRLAQDAQRLNRQCGGVYVTLNRVHPDLLARRTNRYVEYPDSTTNDDQIVSRRWLPIDLDPVRPAGISASDEEHSEAMALAEEIRKYLVEEVSFQEPVLADSGNGWHLLFRVDLPNDENSAQLIRSCLSALDQRFSDDRVSVDAGNYNASRIWKLYGTVADKGDHTADRPHRLARLFQVPDDVHIVSREKLQALADLACDSLGQERHSEPSQPARRNGKLDVGHWLREHNVGVRYEAAYTGRLGRGAKWVLERCVWNPDHTDKSAYVIQFDDGRISAGCQHNSCRDKDWHAMRDAVEPDWRDLKVVGAPSRPESSASRTAKPGRTLAWRPFPVDALPQPLRRFVRRGAKALGCDPCYLILPLLSALAASIGTSRRIRLKRGWTEPAIIWIAMVGESGSLKTPAFKLVMRALRDLQGALLRAHQSALHDYEKDLRDYERDLQTWKRGKDVCDPPEKPESPQAERILVSDTTVEALAPILLANPRGVLLARDELAGWISSFDRYSGGRGTSDAAHWLSMHVGESLTVDRKTGHSRTIFVPRAAVSIAGGIQPRILARVLGQQHRESGLAARMLLAAPPRAPKRWTDSDIAPEHEAELALLYERLMELKPFINGEGQQEPVDVPLLPDASAAFVDFYNDHNRQQTELTGDLAAAWSKLEAYCARIALIIHFTRWAADDPVLKTPDAVDCGSVQAATTIVKWFSHETVRVYAQLDETEEERDRRRLVDWIETKGGEVTVRDLTRGPRQYRGEAEEAEACLNGLVRAGYGTWEGRRPDRAGGRPCRVFKLATSGDGDETPENRGTDEVLSQGNASEGDSEHDPPPNNGESGGDGSGWVRLVI